MPDGITNVDTTVLKLAEQYQSCNVRSRALNDERKQIRENVDKLGITPGAFTMALAMTRDMTTGERADFTGSMNRVLSALDGREADLFGEEEMRKRDERAQKRHDKAETAAEQERRLSAPDTNPRSDPTKGGAGGAKGKGKAKDAAPKKPANAHSKRTKGGDNVVDLHGAVKQSDQAIKDSLAAVSAKEQADGAALLATAGKGGEPVDSGENGKPKAQSVIAAEKLAAAKLDGPLN